jgi:hypothetical protein
MATTTPNFGWPVPTSTDLVKDGATAIEALGDSIDASLLDLKGGTSGQVLAKNSNTDMDFVWVTDAAGDITGVTAGTGISGGGTSGTVTITNSMATAIDAKGDLIAGTGADTFARLAVGANGTVLMADSAEATGLKWATAGGGGKVLQVVQATYSTATTIASTSFTDTGLSGTITPTLSTSKVLVLFTQQVRISRSSVDQASGYQLVRGATSILNLGNGGYETMGLDVGGNGANSLQLRGIISGAYLDSPATTSATTYKTQFKLYTTANSGTSTINENSAPATLILMEIGA